MSARSPVIEVKRIGILSHKRQRGMSDVNDDRTIGATGSSIKSPSADSRTDATIVASPCIWTPCRSGGWLGARAPRVAMTTTIAPPLTEVLNRTLLATWPHMFPTPCRPPPPLSAPLDRARRTRWECSDFGKLIEVPILSIVHRVTRASTTR